MTQNKRIVLNTVATYGRSMFGVVCGLFSARWSLEALGQVDFGLYAVIGGLAIFLGFLNIQFSGSISRYYAFSIGQAQVSEDTGICLMECRAWFTTAVLIHTVLPLVLGCIGWPLGELAIEHGWIVVPAEKINTCICVWRIVCVSSVIGMFCVPFQAMYTAKQCIAELTIYSFLQTIIKTGFIYYMVMHPNDWLVAYAVAMGAVVVFPQVLICIRACMIFPECRIVSSALFETTRVKSVASYALWTGVGGVGYIASHQCMGILLNNYFGARVMSGFGISQTIGSEAASLTGALQGAFQPAITTAYGAENYARVRAMALWACKMGTLLTLIFAIPLSLEIDEILRLWLKTPPPFTAELTLSVLAFMVIEKFTCGHLTAVNATGRIAQFQFFRGVLRCLVIPLAILAATLGFSAPQVAISLPVSAAIVDIGDALLARRVIGLRFVEWIMRVVLPIAYVSLIGFFLGCLPKMALPPSLFRIVLTVIITICGMIFLIWKIVLDSSERELLQNKISARLGNLWK